MLDQPPRPARSPAGARGRASSCARRGRAGRGPRRRCAGGGGRGRCTTATRRRRCRRCRRCRRACVPSARSMISGSSLAQPCCWVNGCQRTRRSSAASSAVVTERKLVPVRSERASYAWADATPSARARGLRRRRGLRWAPRSRRRACSRRTSAPRRSCGRTRSRRVLVALSAGYWLGGRLADRHPHLRRALPLVLAAAALLGAGAVRRRAVPATSRRRAGHDLGRRVRRLAASACSCWSPRRCCCSARWRRTRCGCRCASIEEAGTVAGRLYAISTVGLAGRRVRSRRSLLIPLVGTRRTFLVFALALRRGGGARAAAGASRSPRRPRSSC